MKLKLAQMWDHNGTNMEAIGFMYRTYKVLIALDENQDMAGAHPLSHLAQPLSIFQIHSLNAPSLQGSVIYIASSTCLLDEGEAGV
jgi:hypothetical protein